MIPSPHENHQGAGPNVPLLPRRVCPSGEPRGAVPALPQEADMTPDRIQRGIYGALATLCILALLFLTEAVVVSLIRAWWPS